MVVTALAMTRLRGLFPVVMLGAIYSLLSAALFVTMDAVDVAFTEAAVGAGVATVFLLGGLVLTTREGKPSRHTPLLPLAVVATTGAALIYGTLDMPPYGNPDNPAQRHVAPYYLQQSLPQTGVPNVVTSILASYRGYDTLGETTVIFTAGIGVLLLLGGRDDDDSNDDEEHNR